MSVDEVFTALPVLVTGRLRLRRITETDADGLFDIFADDEVTRYYEFDSFTTMVQAQQLAALGVDQYRRGEAMRWGLVPDGADRIVGTCGYTRWNRQHRFAVLGYDLARAYWGRGLMSEAVAAVLRFGFERLALNRVEATVMVGNAASVALLRRAGFGQEGRLAERVYRHDGFHDVYMFGLTRSGWLATTRSRGADTDRVGLG